MTTTPYRVDGMTCPHCVNAVSAEIGKLRGVTEVTVDFETGVVTVNSKAPLDAGAVRAAVDEAGCELVA